MHGLFSDAGVGAGDLPDEFVGDVVEAFFLQGFDFSTTVVVFRCRNGRRAQNLS
jgi:hypothetical protein